MAKPRVAFFDFTCCEGCQLMVSNLEERLVDLIEIVDIVAFREIMSEKSDNYDIAIIEGSISREREIARLQKIRDRAKLVIALGTCATMGGVNSLKNLKPLDDVRKYVYGDQWERYDTIPARPIDAVINVDYQVHGCPIDREEFIEVVTAIVSNREPRIPTFAVCVECKMRGNVCLFHRGTWCLGPLIRAGCGAICPSNGNSCDGCRGTIPDMNLDAFADMLAFYNMDKEKILDKLNLYNAWYRGESLKPKLADAKR